MTFNDGTLLFWLSQYPILLVREIWCLWKRSHLKPGEVPPKTISMVLQARSWHLSWAAYLEFGIPVHCWVNWHSPVWSTPVPGIIFWAIPIGLLAWNLAWWNKPKEEFPRFPKYFLWAPTQLVLGAILAYVLFPQRGPMPWDF